MVSILTAIFEKYEFAGLIFVSGWIVAVVVSLYFFHRLKEVSKEAQEDKKYFRAKLDENNQLTRSIVRESTEIMVKIVDRFELLQQLILQMNTETRQNRGNNDKEIR